eukprot:7901752-Ditylum_brightwellii.AAC.1
MTDRTSTLPVSGKSQHEVVQGEIPMELGDAAKIKGSPRSNIPIPLPPTILHTMHADIGYGDSTAPGGIKYNLILVDHKSRYCW